MDSVLGRDEEWPSRDDAAIGARLAHARDEEAAAAVGGARAAGAGAPFGERPSAAPALPRALIDPSRVMVRPTRCAP